MLDPPGKPNGRCVFSIAMGDAGIQSLRATSGNSATCFKLCAMESAWVSWLISTKRSPFKTLFALPVGSSRRRRPSRFLISSAAGQFSAVSALMELNLAAPRLQGGVLRSAITSPQTSQRVQGPTCPLSCTDISPTCLSGSLRRSKFL